VDLVPLDEILVEIRVDHVAGRQALVAEVDNGPVLAV